VHVWSGLCRVWGRRRRDLLDAGISYPYGQNRAGTGTSTRQTACGSAVIATFQTLVGPSEHPIHDHPVPAHRRIPQSSTFRYSGARLVGGRQFYWPGSLQVTTHNESGGGRDLSTRPRDRSFTVMASMGIWASVGVGTHANGVVYTFHCPGSELLHGHPCWCMRTTSPVGCGVVGSGNESIPAERTS